MKIRHRIFSDDWFVQDFYTHVVDYIAESDALNGTAFSNAALDPDGASTPLSGGGNAQLEGLPKLVMQVPNSSPCAARGVQSVLPLLCCSSMTAHSCLSSFAYSKGYG